MSISCMTGLEPAIPRSKIWCLIQLGHMQNEQAIVTYLLDFPTELWSHIIFFCYLKCFMISIPWKKDPLNETLSCQWTGEQKEENISNLPSFCCMLRDLNPGLQGPHRLCLLLQTREHAEGKKMSHLLLHEAFQCHLWTFPFLYWRVMWLVQYFPYPD